MAGSYILYKKLHHNGLMTDLGLLTSMFYVPNCGANSLFIILKRKDDSFIPRI